MSFLEIQFPTDISIGARGGPKWRTVITQTQNGWEQRLQKWGNIKSSYDVGYGVKSIAELQTVVGFFNEVRGMAYGFRFKDWLDYSVTDETLTPNGSPTLQLIKTYGSGNNNYVRNIIKPTSGSVTLELNTSSFTDFTIDITTGIVTFTAPQETATITDISNGANANIDTSSPHGFSVGDYVYFTGVVGMTEINTLVGIITSVPTTTDFEVDIDASGFSGYSSGGTANVYVQAGDVFTWSGEYDIPVRFNQDELDVTLTTAAIGSTSITLEEVRL